MKQFDITKESNLIIYGLLDRSEPVIAELLREKFKINAIISDGFEKEYTFSSIAVYSFDEFLNSSHCQKDSVILVILKNIWSHCELAKKLSLHHFKNVLFLPDDSFTMAYQRNTYFYNALLQYQFDQLKGIPCLEEEWMNTDNSSVIIRTEGESVVLWCPAELVKVGSIGSKYHDKSISVLYPYLDFFKKRLGMIKRESEEYFEMQGYKDKRELYLLDREELVRFYERNFYLQRDYFIDSAPLVSWIPKLGFSLLDGQIGRAHV